MNLSIYKIKYSPLGKQKKKKKKKKGSDPCLPGVATGSADGVASMGAGSAMARGAEHEMRRSRVGCGAGVIRHTVSRNEAAVRVAATTAVDADV